MTDWIVVDPSICSGRPTLRGTRIMAKNILGMFAGGYTLERVLDTYPELTREMVEAALEYAACIIDNQRIRVRRRFPESPRGRCASGSRNA